MCGKERSGETAIYDLDLRAARRRAKSSSLDGGMEMGSGMWSSIHLVTRE